MAAILSAINKDHIKGVAVGVGVCAVGYYVYKKNQDKVDGFLKKQGINVQTVNHKDYANIKLKTDIKITVIILISLFDRVN